MIKIRPLTIAKLCANTLRTYVLSYSAIDIQLNARTGVYDTTCLLYSSVLEESETKGFKNGYIDKGLIYPRTNTFLYSVIQTTLIRLLQYQFFSVYSGKPSKSNKQEDGSCMNILMYHSISYLPATEYC